MAEGYPLNAARATAVVQGAFAGRRIVIVSGD
jgi:hypothetical protein